MIDSTLDRATIDAVFSEWDRPDWPGMAVAIVRHGEPIYIRCAGLANVPHRTANSERTVFDIASMTKQFTALAVLQLARDGRLGLDDDVRAFLPELPVYKRPVRIRHCVYHTSGLIDWMVASDLTGPASDYLPFERARRIVCALDDTLFSAGDDHSYSNTGYLLLAWIVARVTGASLPEFLRDCVFEPLGMPHACFKRHPTEPIANQAFGHYQDEHGRLCQSVSVCGVHGDGGMHASIIDMVRWLQAISRHDASDSLPIAHTFAAGHLDNGTALRYAAGWELDRYRGHSVIRHGGLGIGYQSHIAWCPSLATGIVILGNFRPCWPWGLANRVLDTLLGNPPAPTRSAVPAPARAVRADDLVGRYITEIGLPARIDFDRGRLFVDAGYSREPFQPIAVDRLEHVDSGDRLTVHRNAAAQVTHFTLRTKDGACARLHGPIRRAVRYRAVQLDEAALRAYEGRYLSDALQTVYRVEAQGNALIARHLRCSDWRLHPVQSCLATRFANQFAQSSDWPGLVTFQRTPNGAVSGFSVTGIAHRISFHRI